MMMFIAQNYCQKSPHRDVSIGFFSSRDWLESWCLFDVLAFKSFDGERGGIIIASRPTPRHIYNCLQSIIDRAQENRNYRKEIQTKIKWNLIKKARRNHFREFIALHRVESALCASIFHESERINIESQQIEIEKKCSEGEGDLECCPANTHSARLNDSKTNKFIPLNALSVHEKHFCVSNFLSTTSASFDRPSSRMLHKRHKKL